MLIVKDLHSGYDSHQIIRGVSLVVKQGEILALVGPNGAGKSTLLRTIIGLIPLMSGGISFLGQDIAAWPTDRIVHRGLAYVPEGVSLFPLLSVEQNLRLASMTSGNAGTPKPEDMFSLFPALSNNLHQRADHLSGGEKRMLTIARGLLCGPKLILLDDPFLGLSPKVVVQLCDFLRERNRRGLTIIIAGQHVRRILRMSTKACLLEDGQITLEGSGVAFLRNHHFHERMIGLKSERSL